MPRRPSRDIGIAALVDAATDQRISGKVLVVDDRASSRERIATALAAEHKIEVETDPQQALFRVAEGDFDLLMVSLELKDFDALRLVGQVRTIERSRHLPILLITEPEQGARLLRASISVPTTISSARSTATSCSRACARRCAAALHRAAARQPAAIHGAGGHRPAHRPVQPALHGAHGHAGREIRRPRQVALVLILDIDYFQVDQRSLRPRRRRTTCCASSPTHAHLRARHRSDVPLRRRGVRRRHATTRILSIATMVPSESAGRSPASRSGAARAALALRSRSRSGSRPASAPTRSPPRSSSAPTRRSTGPSATAGTG